MLVLEVCPSPNCITNQKESTKKKNRCRTNKLQHRDSGSIEDHKDDLEDLWVFWRFNLQAATLCPYLTKPDLEVINRENRALFNSDCKWKGNPTAATGSRCRWRPRRQNTIQGRALEGANIARGRRSQLTIILSLCSKFPRWIIIYESLLFKFAGTPFSKVLWVMKVLT